MRFRLRSGLAALICALGVAPQLLLFATDDSIADRDRSGIVISDERQTVDPVQFVPIALKKPVTVKFEAKRLMDVAAWIEAELHLAVVVNFQALNRNGRLNAISITDKLDNEPAFYLLDRLRIHRVGWYTQDDQVHLTTLEMAGDKLFNSTYPLGELYKSGIEASTVLMAVQLGIDGQWERIDGAGGDMDIHKDVLAVRQSQRVQRDISGLLAAMHKPGRRTFTNDAPQHIAAREKLDQLVTVQLQDESLAGAIAGVARSSGLMIRIDPNLYKEGELILQAPVSLQVSNQKAATVLHSILEPHKLTWVSQDGTLLVLTQIRAPNIMKTAVFDVRDLCQSDKDSKSLQSLIQSQQSIHWRRLDGTGGDLLFVRPGTLVVRHTEAVLDNVLTLLEQKRDSK